MSRRSSYRVRQLASHLMQPTVLSCVNTEFRPCCNKWLQRQKLHSNLLFIWIGHFQIKRMGINYYEKLHPAHQEIHLHRKEISSLAKALAGYPSFFL